MMTLVNEIPDVEVFIAMPTEELAGIVLRVASQNLQQSGQVHPTSLKDKIRGHPVTQPGYANRIEEAEFAFDEAWSWLVVQGLLIHPTDSTANSGYVRLSRRAKTLIDNTAFRNYAAGVGFHQSFLHPAIAEEVWLDLARGDFGTAVFKSFRAVEISVREAGKFTNDDYGVKLMRAAFNVTTGPLADQRLTVSEREAELALFAGSIGIFKNPVSHRTPTIDGQRTAQEQVICASMLLRIVDTRPILSAPGIDSAT